MLPDRVSNPGPLTYESGALPIALCGPASRQVFTPYSHLLISTMFVVVSLGNQCVLRMIQRLFFLFLNKNLFCDPSLDPS